MTDKISLTDESGKTVTFDPANVKFAACWESGQLNIFFREGEDYAAMLNFAPGEEQNQMDVLAAALAQNGISTISLQNSETGSHNYRFLYRPELVAFYKIHADTNNPEINGLPPLVVDDVPFYVDEKTMDAFRSAVRDSKPDEWLEFTPQSPWPLTSEGGVFAVRKSEAAMVTGYLLGRVIIDMHDRSRIFIAVAEDHERKQAPAVGRLFPGFVSVEGPQSSVHLHARYFDEESTFITVIDFGAGKSNALLVQEESWHIPFRTVADAEQALEKLRQDVRAALAPSAPAPTIQPG